MMGRSLKPRSEKLSLRILTPKPFLLRRVSLAVWDLAFFGRQDRISHLSTEVPLNHERVEWWQRRMKHLLKHVTETWPDVPVWVRKLHRVGPVGGASCEFLFAALPGSLVSQAVRGLRDAIPVPSPAKRDSPRIAHFSLAPDRSQTTGVTRGGKTTVRKRRLATFSPTSGSTRSARCRTKWCEIWASRRTTLGTAGKGGKLTRTWSIRKRCAESRFPGFVFSPPLSLSSPEFFRPSVSLTSVHGNQFPGGPVYTQALLHHIWMESQGRDRWQEAKRRRLARVGKLLEYVRD